MTGTLPTRRSTPGHIPQQYQDADGKWRVRLIASRRKFTDHQQHIYLRAIADHGLKGHAAKMAGVSSMTVNKYLKEDPDFAEAFTSAQEEYQAKVIAHHQDLIFNGTEKRTYDRNGNLVSEEVQYPIRLIEMEIKKVDSDYREKRELDVNVSGGVLVAPATLGSIEDWETKFAGDRSVQDDGEKADQPVTIEGEIIHPESADGKSE